MKSKAILVALLALVLEAQARPVVQSEAAHAAAVWARAGASLGARLGTTVTTTETIAVTNDLSVYAVRLAEGGVVFVSSDTAVEPIVAFTANSDADLSEASPLVRLLRLDAVARQRLAVGVTPSAATAATAAAAGTSSSDRARKWEALLSAAPSAGTSAGDASTSASAKPLSSLNDVRVAPLLKSKWNQESGGGGFCWNYYTPNHIACGCTATAAAQIMRYFKWPTAEMGPETYTCEVEGEETRLTTKGGTYDWDNLPYVVSGTVDEAVRKALGHLTYDVGVTLETEYSKKNGGLAHPKRLGEVYRIFKYAGGYAFWDGTSFSTGKGGLHQLELRKRIIYANLDAKRPVQLAIYGYPKAHLYDEDYWAGHSVVGDGYGFNVVDGVETAYVHINMGWSGLDDMWYNIPEVDAANSGAHVGDGGYDFLYMGGAAFNISPKESGKDILSGRVTDDDGKAVEGAQVTAKLDGAVVQTVTTDANGIYAFALAGDKTYDVSAVSDDGRQLDEIDGVNLRKTVGNSSRVVSDSTNIGNSWGNDMTLAAPDVRIVIGADTYIYSSLDKALAAAREFHKADPARVIEVEVIDDTEFAKSFDVDFPCEIRSADGLFTVTRGKGARFNVTAEGSVVVSNLFFAGSATTLFDVAEGGNVRTGAGVSLGVPETTAAIRTDVASGFTISAMPVEPFAVFCSSARQVDETFGFADCDFATASAVAGKFVNLDDPNREIAGEAVDGGAAPYALKWKLLPVPLEDAVAYYVVDGQPTVTNCFRRLDRLFEILEKTVTTPTTVTLVGNERLTRPVTPCADLKIVSTTGAVISNLASTAGFTVTNGVNLTVSDVSFDGYVGNALFEVNGGSLKLEGDVAIRNVSGTNANWSGAVSVLRGSAVIGGRDVRFENCAVTYENACGGAISLKGTDCELVLKDRVSVTGCSARKYGGGIYLNTGSTASFSGYLTITGNVQQSTVASDVFYRHSQSQAHTLNLNGPLQAGSRIGIRLQDLAGSKAGGEFIGVDADFTDRPLIQSSAAAFVSNAKADLAGEPTEAYSALRWYADDGTVKPVPLEAAMACIVGDGGVRTGYASLEDAFEALAGSGTIELLHDVDLQKTIVLAGAVTLTSGAGGPFVVSRVADCQLSIGAGTSLTVTDLTLSGRLNAERGGVGTLLDVTSGELTLGSGAVVSEVIGGQLHSGAIRVFNNGSFTMLSGSRIESCVNSSADPASHRGSGGGVTAHTSTVRLLGGTIADCTADLGGAVFIGNESLVEIGGDFTAANNLSTDGGDGNVYVSEQRMLTLVSNLTGRVGYTPGILADRQIFGQVSADFEGTDADMADSAHNFRNDLTGDVGFAVRNGNETLLVWSDALGTDGRFVRGEQVYDSVVVGQTLETELPTAVADLVYNAEGQVGVLIGHGYAADGLVATNAGAYVAQLTLKAGFAWKDGSEEKVRTVAWSIAPAELTVTADDKSKVLGENDPELTYGVTGLQGKDTEADTLTGGLARVEGEELGTYPIVRGTLAVVGSNYTLTFVPGTLTIVEPGPGPGPEPKPVPCVPFAFTSIVQLDDGSWKLAIAPVVRYCTYALSTSSDLKTWTAVGEPVEASESGTLTFTVPADGAARFWQVTGYDGVEPADE